MLKRTFLAIKIIPNNNFKNIYLKIKSKFQEDKIKWINVDNLHITLKFLGKTQAEEIEKISLQIEKILSQFHVFELHIRNFGAFPNYKYPHVFLFEIENIKILSDIHKEIEKSLNLIGFDIEKREFKPHLTIARPKYIKNTSKILLLSEKFKDKIIQKTIVDKIIFYESVLDKKGAVYRPLKIYKLTK